VIDKVNQSIKEIENFQFTTLDEVEKFRLKFLSRKGLVGQYFDEFKQLSGEEKRNVGKLMNQFKNLAESKFAELNESSGDLPAVGNSNSELSDLTLPVNLGQVGSIHPLSIVRQRITEIFARMGFTTSEGPEIESDWYNFSALNFPENHPAREMQDTFYVSKGEKVEDDILLRTHTSNVQTRLMEHNKPPLRSIMIGRVYRNEAISARAHCQFHQVEGLYIDKNVSFRDLKDTLYHFAKEMFDKDTEIRLRPSYFPFTEPSAEIDISCFICKGDGCNVCKYSGWVEIAGSGMVDPNVLINVGIDPEEYTGFAFGMGIERITMLKYGVNDLRLFFDNDVRFLNQFVGA
jgi:phenylalanyl-tRNA synthetase alpha chain